MSHVILKTLLGARGLLVIFTMAFACLAFEGLLARAQVSTAVTPTTGTGNLGTTVMTDSNTIQIAGGTRPSNGANLFHSFNQFSVGSLDTAHFLNEQSLPTSNIVARVTSGNPSSIFGTIDTMSYPNANLYLMNPAGIVFGPDATLNVGGSVAFTTADYLRLADANGSDAGIFYSDTTATSILTNVPVAAFGFLGTNPATIEVQKSTLAVQPGQSLSLVGGNTTIQSSMLVYIADSPPPPPSAPGKQVYIASVASPGEVLVGTLVPAANIKVQSPGMLGKVEISQESKIDTSNNDGGTIRIQGGHLVIDASVISASTGNIELDATSIQIIDATQIKTKPTSSANAGHITMKASGDIDLDSSAVQSISGNSPGGTGNITFSSSQGNVNIVDSFVTSQVDISGNAGSITLDAPHGDIVLSGTELFNRTDGTGTLGGVQITANNLLLNSSIIGGNNFARQVAGNLTITLEGRLSLAGESQISTGTLGQADAADLIIRGRDILLTDKSSLVTSSRSSGDAGQLQLFADSLRLTDGGRLSSRSFGNTEGGIPAGRGGVIRIQSVSDFGTTITIDGPGSGLFTGTTGSGPGGRIDLSTRSLTIQNSGTISASTTGTDTHATGGSIIINATDQVALTNNASITASSIIDPETPNSGIADAGNISINAGQQLDLLDNSSITTTTKSAQANGGDIDIRAIDRVRLLNNSEISTSVKGAEGSGGNIFIDPKVVVLQGSTVTAQAVGGTGGNITFVTPLFLADSASVISASSQRGVSGTVTIQSPTSNISGTVGQLTAKTSPPQVLLQNRCVALAGGEQSTFLLAGRDALPAEPGGWLSSPVSMEHWTGEETEEHASGLMVRSRGWNTQPPLVMANDKMTVLSLRRLTPPGFLVQSFATAPTGCSS